VTAHLRVVPRPLTRADLEARLRRLQDEVDESLAQLESSMYDVLSTASNELDELIGALSRGEGVQS